MCATICFTDQTPSTPGSNSACSSIWERSVSHSLRPVSIARNSADFDVGTSILCASSCRSIQAIAVRNDPYCMLWYNRAYQSRRTGSHHTSSRERATSSHQPGEGSPMQNATILVVDDEPPILDLIVSYLRADGFTVHTARDGPSALAQARALRPDLIVLDVLLPGMDGLEVCRRIQQEFDVYVLMLTARAEELDKIVGLSVGADDYLTKPFSPRELVVRVKAILRRSRTAPGNNAARAPERPALRFDDIQIDPDTREVWHDGGLVELTPREFDLLYALAEHPGRVFSR